jgi:hypothetical protein
MNIECNKDILRWNKLQNRLAEVSIANAFVKLRGAQIEPILIKGWAISRLYPENHSGISFDSSAIGVSRKSSPRYL